MRDEDLNLWGYQRLKTAFGPFVESDSTEIPARTEHELIGEQYRHMLGQLARIVSYQWRQELKQSALKGFLFHGGVGLGKTMMAKRLAYELCRLFGDDGVEATRPNEVLLMLVDGADVARGRYGESEEQLKELFNHARRGNAHGPYHAHGGHARRRTVMLFDDVESLFLTRSSGGAKEWHFSQNSVFFHAVDELDTASSIVILTTNRIDLVDEAIVDRFRPYEFGLPPAQVLDAVAREKGRLQGLEQADLAGVLARVHTPGAVKSIREVERLIMEAFVEKALST